MGFEKCKLFILWYSYKIIYLIMLNGIIYVPIFKLMIHNTEYQNNMMNDRKALRKC